MTGEDRGPHRDAVLMGTSLVLEVAGLVGNPKDGVDCAATAIDDGAASAFVDKFRNHFQTS